MSSDAPSQPPGGVDNYQLGREIARGGMGSVLEAEDAKLKRIVAAKVMLLDAEADESARQRFLREAEVLAMLAHPNIVPIHDIVWEDGRPLFYTMKLVKGRTLQAILNALRKGDAAASQEYTLDRLLLVFRKVCDAIAFAHSRGIIHRDLKPDNVMVGEFGEVLVMDWGIAKQLRLADCGSRIESSPAAEGSAVRTPNSEFDGTIQGSVMGTPQYMSPEQAMGWIDQLDERSDIFSLGGILYAILTLRPPVEGATLDEVLRKVSAAEITAPTSLNGAGAARQGAAPDGRRHSRTSGGRVPVALSSVVMKALRFDKSQRYQNVAELSGDVEKYQAGFATTAEQAGALKQIQLLMLRHKAAAVSLAAMLLLSIGFVLKVMASERKATQNARLAALNEQRASEQTKETQRALVASQLTVADAAFRGVDLPAMVDALDSVPEELRDQRWHYLSAKRDASMGDFKVAGFEKVVAVRAVPGKAGLFAIADARGRAGIVDVRTGTVLRIIQTSFRGPLEIAVSEDGQQLAVTAPEAADIQLFREGDGEAVRSVRAPSSHVAHMLFSPDGSLLVAVDGIARKGPDKKLSLINLRDGSIRWQRTYGRMSALFSHDGTRLFVADALRRSLNVLGVEDGKTKVQQEAHLACMALNKDGKRIALGLLSGEVMVLDAETGGEIRRARLHPGSISRILWTADDHLLSLGGEGAWGKNWLVMRLWESASFSPQGTFFGIRDDQGTPEFDLNPVSGHLLWSGNPPHLWRIPAGIEAARISSDMADQAWTNCFLSDTVLLARTQEGWAATRYDVSDPRAPKDIGPRVQQHLVAVSHQPGGLVALASRTSKAPYSIRIHDIAGGEMVLRREIPISERIARLDFDSEGRRVLAVSLKSGLSLFDVQTGEAILKLPQSVERAVFTGAGDHFAAIVPRKRLTDDVEDEIILFDARRGGALKRVLYRFRLNELAASPDRKLIAVGGKDQVVRVLDAVTLAERLNFRAHDAEISAMAFHPKLPVLATASPDGSVKLWDYETARLRESFIGFDGRPVLLAFSPNGRLLSVEGQGRTCRLFDLGSAHGASAPKPVKQTKPDNAERYVGTWSGPPGRTFIIKSDRTATKVQRDGDKVDGRWSVDSEGLLAIRWAERSEIKLKMSDDGESLTAPQGGLKLKRVSTP